MSPEFIILLPVRNGGAYLSEAIDSILLQTIGTWRLLVLENGSSDNTVDVVRGYRDPRIVLAPADRPLSIERNWGRSLSVLSEQGVAAEAILTFIGHDDAFAPTFLAQIAGLVDQHPDATLYQTPFDLIDAGGRPIRPCRPIPARESAADLVAALCWGIRDSFGTGYAFRAGDFRAVGGFPPFPRLLYADHLLFSRLAGRGYKAASANVGCSYRLHHGSASNTASADSMNSHVVALQAFVEALDVDFPDFTETDLGRAAIAVLLARELFILDTPVIRRSLDTVNLARSRALTERLSKLRAGPSTTFPGSLPDVSPFIARMRRLKLTTSFLRRRGRT